MRYVRAILVLVLFLIPDFLLGQPTKKSKLANQLSISLGASFQKFFLEQKFPSSTNAFLPVTGAEQNPEGFGLTIPIEFYNPNGNWGILADPILRYDVVTPQPFQGNGLPEDEYSVFADLHLSFHKKFKVKWVFKNPLKIGVGYSFISPFLSFEEPNPQLLNRKEIDLSFQGYHLFISIPLHNKIYLKQQFMYVPNGQIMYRDYEDCMMYHLSVEINTSIFSRKEK